MIYKIVFFNREEFFQEHDLYPVYGEYPVIFLRCGSDRIFRFDN